MASYELFSMAFKACPHDTFAQMRRDDPIYGHRDRNGKTMWYVTRYNDVIAVMRDPRFIKDAGKLSQKPAKANKSLTQSINQNMLFSDPPDHTRLRGLVNQAFTPRRVEQMGPAIQATCDRLIDAFESNSADLIADYALPFTVQVISDLLGIPDADRDQVAEWSQSIISPGGRRLKASERKRQMRAFVDYLNAMFAERQRNPQDDLISALVQAEEAGERLNEKELSSMIALLLVTGHETTVNLIGNGMLALLQHPDQLAKLRANPTLIDSAIEELLRFDGPVETSTTRWVAEDMVYQGHEMRQGDIMRVVITSANRDPAVFAEPDSVDITRENNRHLQFGMGIHYCLGAPLARLEGKIGIMALLNRLPELKLVNSAELKFRPGVLFRGLEALPVTWTVPLANSH